MPVGLKLNCVEVPIILGGGEATIIEANEVQLDKSLEMQVLVEARSGIEESDHVVRTEEKLL